MSLYAPFAILSFASLDICVHLVEYDKVNIIKRETTIFTKSKHPFIHKLGYHTQGYIMGYMSFVPVVKMESAYQKQNGHGNLVLVPWVTSEVTSYQATCQPNPIHSKFCLPASYVNKT
jgi:hypothetical protein